METVGLTFIRSGKLLSDGVARKCFNFKVRKLFEKRGIHVNV